MPSAVFHDRVMASSAISRCSRDATPSRTTRLRPMVPASDHRSSTIRPIPPTINVTQTMVVSNSTSLMKSWNSRPSTAEGKNASSTEMAKRRAAGSLPGRSSSTFHSRAK